METGHQLQMRCWGVSGATPAPGKDKRVYGGNTPCGEIRDASGQILIFDGGSGIRELGQQLWRDRFTRVSDVLDGRAIGKHPTDHDVLRLDRNDFRWDDLVHLLWWQWPGLHRPPSVISTASV